MSPALLVAAFLCQSQLEHTVRLTPEATVVKQGDPLLVRVDVRFGLLRPSHYPVGPAGLSDTFHGLLVFVRKPGGTEFEVVRTKKYYDGGTICIGSGPASRVPPGPPGKTDAGFLWLVLDHEPPDPMSGAGPGPGATVFGAPGDYSLRAEVRFRDATDARYAVRSAPVAVRAEPLPVEARTASGAVRVVLNYALPEAGSYLGSPAARAQLRDALPLLGQSGAGSAARRLLALDDLKTSTPGESRRKATAACDRLREALPPVGQAQFDLDYARALAAVREYKLALDRAKLAPPGPRQFWDVQGYYEDAQRYGQVPRR